MPKLKKKKSFLSRPLFWSNGMEATFDDQVKDPIFNHKNSDRNNSVYYGFPFDVIRNKVLNAGRGDFSSVFEHEEHGRLTTAQMATLYGFVNMKKHFYSAYANFRLQKGYLQNLFDDHERVVLIDIGCGPGTAGLALANLFPERSFKYFGVDRARAMRNKTRNMMRSGKSNGLVHKNTSVVCKSTWQDVPRTYGEDSAVVINFSYFFASPFLTKRDCHDLAKFFRSIRKYAQNPQVAISYTNSPLEIANRNYRTFISELGITYEDCPPKEKTVKFRRSKYSHLPGQETFHREIFEVKD